MTTKEGIDIFYVKNPEERKKYNVRTHSRATKFIHNYYSIHLLVSHVVEIYFGTVR
jgi:hypothetical protein